ncbi:MAG TPA: TonB family protein [Vicinamibacterales bacterium]|nr:TonB family protein [Vicinamibacterales bacterium]
MRARRIALAALLGILLSAAHLHAQDSFAAARDLYASAQYDEALSLLNRLSETTFVNDERQSVDLYRSLCLLAVGRRDDADRAIEAIVARDPLYRPAADLPPRTRAAFSDAKKRVLPVVVQERYDEAKRAFDGNEFEAAAAAFERVVKALDDPDIGMAPAQLSDLRTLAVGFHALSVKSIPPPPPPPPPPPVAAPEPPVNLPPRIHTGEEAGLRLPVTIAQELPRYPGIVPPGGIKGVVEVVIDEKGSVESAEMVVPVSSSYDKMVLTAVSRWQFQPARLNGAGVKFRKRIQINIAPPPR